MKSKTTTALASAAALLFAAGAAWADDAKAHAGQIKCEGVNSCHGQSECKTAKNDCAGKNGCSGQGFKWMTKAECDAAKAKVEK